jgi:hypothetical protein
MGKSRKFDPDDYEDDYGFTDRKENDWRDERKEKRAKKEAIDVEPPKTIWQPKTQRARR